MSQVDRQLVRRTLFFEAAQHGLRSGRELLAKLKVEDVVYQVHVCRTPPCILNVRIELAPEQQENGAARVWINVNLDHVIESMEMEIEGDEILLGDSIRSLGR